MLKISASKLADILDSKFDCDPSIAIRDLFAVGCYLHLSGKTEEGAKACRTALRSIGYSEGRTDYYEHAEYFGSLFAHLGGNKKRFAHEVRAHGENMDLFW